MRARLAGRHCSVVDLVDPATLAGALQDVDVVIHLASPNERACLVRDDTIDVALRGTFNVVTEACRAGVRRILFGSSVWVYGHTLERNEEIREDLAAQPNSRYGFTRLAQEAVLASQTIGSSTEAVILRTSTVIGAPAHPDVDRWTLAGNDLCRQAVETGMITLSNSGLVWRDFIAVAELLRAIDFIVDLPANAMTAYGHAPVLNLATGKTRLLLSCAEEIASLWGSMSGARTMIRRTPSPAAPARPFHVSVARLAALGFGAHPPIDEELRRTLDMCRSTMVARATPEPPCP
jgi:UDP-glucose 4-epimerase